MDCIIVDIGNTRSKIATSRAGRLETGVAACEHAETLERIESACKTSRVDRCLIASVAATGCDLLEPLRAKGIHATLLSHEFRYPFKIGYTTPSTLGVDRLAAVAGVVGLEGLCDAIVIDAGTAITYDYLTRDGEYLGGAISPGVGMRFRALHDYTARLPLCGAEDLKDIRIGTDTRGALAAGVVGGVQAEVKAIIAEWRERRPGMRAYVTGGDYKYFEMRTEISIFAVPNLVLDGLAYIAESNQDKF